MKLQPKLFPFPDPASVISQSGTYTVFAPTDQAFSHLPSETLDALQRPENRDRLVKLLAYHVVPGRIDALRLRAAIRAGHGTAQLCTVAGNMLAARLHNPECFELVDERGSVANVSGVDIDGIDAPGQYVITHIVDRVLLPLC